MHGVFVPHLAVGAQVLLHAAELREHIAVAGLVEMFRQEAITQAAQLIQADVELTQIADPI